MNTIYPKRHVVNAFIARLMQEPYFLDGTLTMYADVPVKCLRYKPNYCDERENLCSAPDKYRFDAFDFLVCRGKTAVASICFNNDWESSRLKELFGNYLAGLDCIAHSAETLDDFALAEFYPLVAQRLDECAQTDSCCTDYTLEPKRIDVDLITLQKNCLLEDSGYASAFRRDCGIFYRCYTEEDGSLCKEPVTCAHTFPEQARALSWQSEANEDTAELQKILDMSLKEFCGNNMERFIECQEFLDAFAGHLDGFPSITMANTYRDFLRAHSDCNHKPRHTFPTRKAVYLVMTRLERLLSQVIRDEDFPFFKIPLHRYYTAAANLAGCYYPLWLYQNMIRPHLCNQPEDSFTVSNYAGYEHAHLTNFMVEPICIPGKTGI